MVRIADHHKWQDTDFKPQCAWAENDYVQWGSSGLVLGGKKSYTTAFFEVFPASKENGGFIRGEGKTIAGAEQDAFDKYAKSSNCNHLWGREKYTNGGQLCRHCRAFRSGHLKPIVKFGWWREPLDQWDFDSLRSTILNNSDNPSFQKHMRIIKLRNKMFPQSGVSVSHD